MNTRAPGVGLLRRMARSGGGGSSRAAFESIAAGAVLQLAIAVSGVVSARLLGVDDRGRLALLWIVTGVSAQIVTLALHTAISYAIAAGEPTHETLHRVRRQIALQLAIAPLVSGAAMAAVAGGSRSTLIAAAAMLPVAPAFVLRLYAIAIVQGERRYRAIQINRLLQPVVFAGLMVTLAIAGDGDLILISAVWSATMVGAGLIAWRHALGAWRPRVERTDVRGGGPLRRFGLRSFFGAFGTTEHLMVDQLLLGLLLSARQFGLYVAANAFANLPRFLGQSVGFVAYPEVAAAGERQLRVLSRFVLVDLAVTLPVVLVLLATIGSLLPALFGDAFSDAVPIAEVLLIAAFLQSVRRVLSEASRGLGSGFPGTVGELAFMVVLVALAIPLASSGEGAAVAVAIAALAGCLALAAQLARPRFASGRVRPAPLPEPELEIESADPRL